MDDDPGRRVFVYGTLKPGGFYWPRFCEGKVGPPVEAKVRGRLFHLPAGYPALVAGGGEWARGFVLEFLGDAALAGVDGLEGYDPDGPPEANEYERIVVDGFRPDGGPLGRVWTYVMDEAKARGLGGEPVDGGNWKGAAEERNA
jgi:gamma-glutamylcyclotransferase (GGCT)/AIG2-like uncharacterized protein YtfP